MAIGRLTHLADAITPTTGLSISATVPNDGSVVAGDLLLVACTMLSGSRTFVISGGSGSWTSLGIKQVPGHSSEIWFKIASSGDLGASITVTHTGGAGGMRQLLVIGKMSGVSGVTPLGSPVAAAGSATSTQSTTKTSPALAGVAATSRELGLAVDTRAANTPNTSVWTPPADFTTAGTLITPSSSGVSMVWGDADATGSGAMGSRTWTADQPAYGSAWALAALEGATTIPAALTRQIVGAPAETGFTVAALTSDVTTGVRLAVDTDPALAAPTYFGPEVPDGEGYVKLTATGLTAGTQYYYLLELDGDLGDRVGACRTLPAAGSEASFSFAVGSCALTGSTHAVFDAIRTRTGDDGLPALFFAHIGDLQYLYGGGAVAPASQATLTEAAEAALASEKQRLLYEAIPVSYTWSDLDWGGSNSDGTWAGNADQNAVYRKLWPHPSIPVSQGIYRSWVVGRVRFIQTDSRSFMSAKSATDDSSKTMLGTVQKAWLKMELTQAEPVKVWLHDNAWQGTPSNPGNDDRWRAYNTERTELADYITANSSSVGRLLYVHGDTHSLAADDGTNNAYGGFPFVGVACMDQVAGIWDLGALTGGSYPGSTVNARQYGWFDVTDTGDSISISATGYDHTGTARVTLTVATVTAGQNVAAVGVPPSAVFGAAALTPGVLFAAAPGIGPSAGFGQPVLQQSAADTSSSVRPPVGRWRVGAPWR